MLVEGICKFPSSQFDIILVRSPRNAGEHSNGVETPESARKSHLLLMSLQLVEMAIVLALKSVC